jgi:hypothetical protein
LGSGISLISISLIPVSIIAFINSVFETNIKISYKFLAVVRSSGLTVSSLHNTIIPINSKTVVPLRL